MADIDKNVVDTQWYPFNGFTQVQDTEDCDSLFDGVIDDDDEIKGEGVSADQINEFNRIRISNIVSYEALVSIYRTLHELCHGEGFTVP